LDFCHIARWFPAFDLLNLGFLHLDFLSAYLDSEVVDFSLFKLALVNVEVEVILSQDSEHFSDEFPVSLQVLFFSFIQFSLSMHCYVIHVDCEGSTGNLLAEYSVHHGLEHSWWVGEAEEHHLWLEESSVSYECHFMLVLFDYLDSVVPPIDINHRDKFGVTYSVD
jgi:hypothetical protein